MGRRRVRCLKALGYEDIFGFDTSKFASDKADELGIKYTKLEDFDSGAVLISTPPKHHLEYVEMFINKGCHVFCEASVIPSDRFTYDKIKRLTETNLVQFFPSATIKFKDSVSFIKECLDKQFIGEVLSYDYRFAQNLRTWHPYQDIKDYYVSDPDTGAGREMAAFELSWLTWLFGINAKIINSHIAKVSEISVNTGIDDYYSFSIQHEKAVGSVVIDVFSHTPYRFLRVSGTSGNIEFDWVNNRVTVENRNREIVAEYSTQNTQVAAGYTNFSTEKMYVDEVANFFESIGDPLKSKCTIDHDFKILELVEKIEES
jgi:predicted dehydrogenase